MGDRRTVGPGSSGCGDAPPLSLALDPGDGPIHSRGTYGVGLASFPAAGKCLDNGVGVGSCAGIDSDDVVVFSATKVTTASPPFPVGGRLVGAGPGGVIGRRISNESHVPRKGCGLTSMKPYQVAGFATPNKTDESLKSHPEISEDNVLMSHILVGGIYLACET